MKVLLSILSAMCLTSTGAAALTLTQSPQSQVTNVSLQNETLSNNKLTQDVTPTAVGYTWDNTGLNLGVSVDPSGTHEDGDLQYANNATAKVKFADLAKLEYVVAVGEFDLHTYHTPMHKKTIMLYKLETTDGTLKWQSEYNENRVDVWSGWGHQTSEIRLTVTASENDEGIINLMAENYVYVRTAGSTHSPWTRSIVQSFDF